MPLSFLFNWGAFPARHREPSGEAGGRIPQSGIVCRTNTYKRKSKSPRKKSDKHRYHYISTPCKINWENGLNSNHHQVSSPPWCDLPEIWCWHCNISRARVMQFNPFNPACPGLRLRFQPVGLTGRLPARRAYSSERG